MFHFRTKTVTTVASRSRSLLLAAAGPTNGLVEKSYRLLFFDFFAPFFFVDFLAFLAAM